MTSPGTLLVRADASAQIGWGHVMRCLALAQAWQDHGGDCIFSMAEPAEALLAQLRSENIKICMVSAAPGSADDADQLSNIARETSARWIVVDGYYFGSEYCLQLRKAGHKVMALGDYGHAGAFDADLLLDQNAGTNESFYAGRARHTRLLLGPRYALLRREFNAWRHWKREIPPQARRVLVTMGGSDPENLTERAVRALNLVADRSFEATVLVGGSNVRLAELTALTCNSKHKIRIETNVSNIPELMATADLAISAAGSTCWEMCALGLPAVVIDAAENQAPIARTLATRGIATHISRPSADANNIAEALALLVKNSDIRSQMSTRGRQLVDGRGPDRVVAALRVHGFKLRPVNQNDCGLLWEWANDPVVRRASFSSNDISWQEHCNWFAEKTQDRSALFLMFEEGNSPAAVIRTQALIGSLCEISVTLAPEIRGHGLAPFILERAIQEIFARSAVSVIHAFVKPENLASLKSFEHAGFYQRGTARVKDCDALHYVREREPENIPSSIKHDNQAHEAMSC